MKLKEALQDYRNDYKYTLDDVISFFDEIHNDIMNSSITDDLKKEFQFSLNELRYDDLYMEKFDDIIDKIIDELIIGI